MSKTEQIKEGYKPSPLGPIPADWEVKQLGECFKLSSGKSKPNEVSDTKRGDFIYPVYGGNGIMAYSKIFNEEGRKILIGRVGEYCGITSKVDGRYWITDNSLFTTEISESIGITFLTYKLQFEDLSKLRNKGGQPLVSQKPIYLKKISLPSFAEQTAIANLLNTWDKAIQTTTQLIAQKEQRKKWLMQQLLTGKKRLKGFEGKWKKDKLGHVGEFSKGGGVSKAELKESGFPAIRYGEIYTTYNIVVEKFYSFIDTESARQSKAIFRNDILFAGSGETAEEIGKCVTYLHNEQAYAGGDIIILRPKKGNNSLFLSYLLNSDAINKQKSSLGKGHSVVHIYPRDLTEINLDLPPLEEQIAIANVLQGVDKEMQLFRSTIEQMKQQKKGLMQQLLTGKKRLKID